MAARHHISTHTCRHCATEFTGRKKLYCSPKCCQSAQYQRKRERGVKGFSGKTRRPPHPIVDGHRVCLDCERNLPIIEFPEHRSAKSGYRGQCKPCFAEFNRKRKPQRSPHQRRIERIRTATNRGECGPPTLAEHEARLEKFEQHHSPSPQRLEREARTAWNKWLMFDAPEEWCNRYWSARGEPWRSRGFSEAERYRLRYRGDAGFATKQRIRSQITKAMKRSNVSDLMRTAIKRQGNSPRVEALLGYTITNLCDHLEKQFTRGMSWERFASGEIHIDHITPQAAFDLSDDDQWQACWCLSNLRPCWAHENLRKSARIEFLI